MTTQYQTPQMKYMVNASMLFATMIFVFWVMALVGAVKGQTKSLPFIENIKLIK